MKTVSISFIISLLLYATAYSQRMVSMPFGKFYDEDAPVQVGIKYGYVNNGYRLKLNDSWSDAPINYGEGHILSIGRLAGISARSSHGMNVGIPIDVNLNDCWQLNVHPSLQFINRASVRYSSRNPSVAALDRRMRHVENDANGSNFNSLDLPVRLKLRSEEKKLRRADVFHYRGFIAAGGQVTRHLGIVSEYRALSESPIRTDALIMKTEYASWVVALGAELFFEHFKVSPELSFAQSFGNILNNRHELSQNNPFMGKLQGALARNIRFSLIFQ